MIITDIGVNHYFTMFTERNLPAESPVDEDKGCHYLTITNVIIITIIIILM